MTVKLKKQQVVYCIFKRFFDIFFSLIGIVLLVPIMIIVGPIIKLQDGGPVFFKQARTGKGGKEFCLIKFRSMPVDNDVRNFEKEDQMTKIGGFIRKTSIDELPQCWNILKGEMSFVGPRPWIPDYYQNMSETQKRRFIVRPGITGLAQVNGRNGITVVKKIQYDLEYIDKMSILEDVKILLLTVGTIFKKETACGNKHTVRDEIAELKKRNGAGSK